jgi:hypothetical protein
MRHLLIVSLSGSEQVNCASNSTLQGDLGLVLMLIAIDMDKVIEPCCGWKVPSTQTSAVLTVSLM